MDVPECPCAHCNPTPKTMEEMIEFGMRFTMCPLCGNKRCPKGTDHRLECTHSNEPGQPGSSYE